MLIFHVAYLSVFAIMLVMMFACFMVVVNKKKVFCATSITTIVCLIMTVILGVVDHKDISTHTTIGACVGLLIMLTITYLGTKETR